MIVSTEKEALLERYSFAVCISYVKVVLKVLTIIPHIKPEHGEASVNLIKNSKTSTTFLDMTTHLKVNSFSFHAVNLILTPLVC